MTDSSGPPDQIPVADPSNDHPQTDHRKSNQLDAWGCLGLGIGGIAGSMLASFFVESGMQPVGFGLGAGWGAYLGLRLNAKLRQSPFPSRLASAFLMAMPVCGVFYALIIDDWGTMKLVLWVGSVATLAFAGYQRMQSSENDSSK